MVGRKAQFAPWVSACSGDFGIVGSQSSGVNHWNVLGQQSSGMEL